MSELVCLHAAGSGPDTWTTVAPVLGALGHRVHCPPLLGHHAADRRPTYPLDAFRDAVLHDLDRRGLDRVTLVGHSLGAFVATTVAAGAPDRVDRLVLEEMPVPPRDGADGPPSRRRIPAVAHALAGFLGRGRVDPAVVREVVAELREPRPRWWEGLASVTAPTLLLAGGPKSHLDQSRHDLVARAIPDATVVRLDTGHRVHSTAPEAWLAATTPFLATP